MASVLIIEDDEPLRSFLTQFLKEEGFVVEGVESGSKGISSLSSTHPDLVILDLGLPDVSGETILSRIKADYPDLPVIILTAKSGVDKIVEGLNLGADDYLPKPFSYDELLARIRARLRHPQKSEASIKIDDLVIDFKTREVTRNHKLVKLTKTEFDLLAYLAKNQDRVVTHTMILNHVWGYASDIESRVVDVYISYLRKKIDRDAAKKLIHTKRGVGYYFKIA